MQRFQGTPLVLTSKLASPNKSSSILTAMGMVFQKSVFDGEKGYQEAQGNRKEMTSEEVEKAKKATVPFDDLANKNGTLLRIEPIDGSNAFVIKINDTEVFYDTTTGLKVKEVKTVKTPDGNEMTVPTSYADYKEVNGVKFPHSISLKSGPMDLNFTVQEIKINEGVTDEDFK